MFKETPFNILHLLLSIFRKLRDEKRESYGERRQRINITGQKRIDRDRHERWADKCINRLSDGVTHKETNEKKHTISGRRFKTTEN